MRRTRIPRLLGVRNYLNNYFAYKGLTCTRIHVGLPSPAFMGLRIIQIIIWPINDLLSSHIRVEHGSPAYEELKII